MIVLSLQLLTSVEYASDLTPELKELELRPAKYFDTDKCAENVNIII